MVVFFLRVFAIQVPMYGVAVLLYAVLQAHKRFFWPAFAPIMSTVVVTVTYLVYAACRRRSRTRARSIRVRSLVGVGHHARRRRDVLPHVLSCPRARGRLRPTLRFPAGWRRASGRWRSPGSVPSLLSRSRWSSSSWCRKPGRGGHIHGLPLRPAGLPAALRRPRRPPRDLHVPAARRPGELRRPWRLRPAGVGHRPCGPRRGSGRRGCRGRGGALGGDDLLHDRQRRPHARAEDDGGTHLDGTRPAGLRCAVPRLALAVRAGTGPRRRPGQLGRLGGHGARASSSSSRSTSRRAVLQGRSRASAPRAASACSSAEPWRSSRLGPGAAGWAASRGIPALDGGPSRAPARSEHWPGAGWSDAVQSVGGHDVLDRVRRRRGRCGRRGGRRRGRGCWR